MSPSQSSCEMLTFLFSSYIFVIRKKKSIQAKKVGWGIIYFVNCLLSHKTVGPDAGEAYSTFLALILF
jgi:hypothetical protein